MMAAFSGSAVFATLVLAILCASGVSSSAGTCSNFGTDCGRSEALVEDAGIEVGALQLLQQEAKAKLLARVQTSQPKQPQQQHQQQQQQQQEQLLLQQLQQKVVEQPCDISRKTEAAQIEAIASAAERAVAGEPAAAALLVALTEAELASSEQTGLARRTTTTTTTTTTTDHDVETMGLSYNAEGDLTTFVSALFTDTVACVVIITMFMVLRVRYPLMYSKNVLMGTAPSSPDSSSPFSWFQASIGANLEQHIASSGLDQAMLLEFSSFGMKLCLLVGLPMLCITSPINLFFGGHLADEKHDHMSLLSLGNVRPGSMVYWVTAAAVWFTVLVSVRAIFQAQEKYMHLRWRWCRHMATSRANTVLVEGIPDQFQSDAELRKFFDVLFPGDRIQSTYCVKDTAALCKLLQQLADVEHNLVVAKTQRDQTPEHPPMITPLLCGAKVDAVTYWEEMVADVKPRCEELRKTITEACSAPGAVGGYFCSSGFVTFYERSDAEIAVRMTNISTDSMEWLIDHPPEPSDVLWVDLMQDPTAEVGRHVLGYCLVAGLYFAYMPLVLGITNIAKLIDMGPTLQPFWAGIAPTFGLTIMVSFLPTFIIAIFKLFFTLRAEAWAQARLQEWYFWFNMVFVVMATAVAQNTADFTRTIATSPFDVFNLLANSMPYATHFYVNYIVMQWPTHCMNLLRYANLSKFKIFSALYEEEEAVTMSEPEDQDYYGVGSRSARWTTVLVIGLVFGTLCPPIFVVTFINFLICRVVYGYLIPFAETRKPDLGGVFWTTQLRHVFHGLMLYCMLMTGVLAARGPGRVPMFVVAPALGYVIVALKHFDSHFGSPNLPLQELMSEEGKAKHAKLVKRFLKDEGWAM
mmetsp:Transcript_12373/g.43585  ORF Transcript_12373/g.43585 Transcript_12373/m.43585 type:complete len:862 (-) Transcript_12373:207-2792(-)